MQFVWFLLVLLVTLSQSRQQPNADCVALIQDEKISIMQVPEGSMTATPYAGQSWPVKKQLSPDGLRLVRVKKTQGHEIKNTVTSSELEVEVYSAPVPFADKYRPNLDPYAEIDINWSPDSQWIVYLRNPTPEQTYITLTNNVGILVKEIAISHADEMYLQIDRWSPNSQYFSLLIRQMDDQENRHEEFQVKYFSAPDLKDVTPAGLHLTPRSSCDETNLYTEVYCTRWTKEGNQAVLINIEDKNAQLVVSTMGTSHIQRFKLPDVLPEWIFRAWIILWAPNNKYIAVFNGAEGINASQDYIHNVQMHIFGLDGTKHLNLEIDNFTNVSIAPYFRVQWAWHPDSSVLYYIRESKQNTEHSEVAGFNVVTGNKQVLLSFPKIYAELVELSPSPDGQALFVSGSNQDDSMMYLLSTQGKVLMEIKTSRFLPLSGWSPHQSYIAITRTLGEDPNHPEWGLIEIYNSDGNLILREHIDDTQPGFIDWVICS